MKYVLLDPAFAGLPEGARILDSVEFEDVEGKTVIEVADDFSWLTNRPNFDTMTVEVCLDPIRQAKKNELSEVRDTVVLTTVETTSYGTFFGDDKTKILMLGEIVGILLMESAGLMPPATVDFKRVDGWHTFDLADFKMAAIEVLGGIKGIFATQKALEATIDSLTDPAQIAAVEWPTDP